MLYQRRRVIFNFLYCEWSNKGLIRTTEFVQGTVWTFRGTEVLAPEFINDHEGGVPQILTTRNILFNTAANPFFSQNIKVFKIVQRCIRFVTLGPGVYHGSFNTEYNIAKATIFADYSSPKKGRALAKKKGSVHSCRTLCQWSVFLERGRKPHTGPRIRCNERVSFCSIEKLEGSTSKSSRYTIESWKKNVLLCE